jgi:hypothetical protein
MSQHAPPTAPRSEPPDCGGYGDLEEARRYRYSDERERVGSDGLPEYTDDESKRPRFNSGHGEQSEGTARSDSDVEKDVRERLEAHPDIDAQQISLTVENGEVTLAGRVSDAKARSAVEEEARGVAGVQNVHNRLEIPGD